MQDDFSGGRVRLPSMRLGAAGLLLAAAVLQGCDRGADSGATANPVAPGRPGTGNPTAEVQPRPGSINESPQVGGSTAQIPEGITGSGGPTKVPQGMQGRSHVPRQVGSGLDGGLDDSSPRPDGMATAPASGSPNRVSGNAVGQR